MCAGDDSAPSRALGGRPSPPDDPFLLSCVRDGRLHRREAGVTEGAGRGRCMTLGETVTPVQEKDVCHKVKNSLSLSPLIGSFSPSTRPKIAKPAPKVSPPPSSPLPLAVPEFGVPLLKL